ncbi:MAG: Rrf2 family transcriptional regulator, partial [Oscillospiraceae bacterium]
MYITLESDYAIRIVYLLAQENTKIDAKTISEKTGVTFRFALKILRKLVAQKIVKSYKGTKGGYMLDKDPSKISLKNIIEIIEGEIVLSRCILGEFPCTKEHNSPCKMKKEFTRISLM